MDILLPNEQVLKVKRTTRKNSVGLKVQASQNTLLVPKTMTDRQVKRWVSGHYAWLEATLGKQHARLQKQQAETQQNAQNGFVPPKNHIQVWGEWISLKNVQNLPGLVDFEFELEKGLKALLKVYLEEQVAFWAEKMGVTEQVQSIGVRFYKTRWGSCDAQGRLRFNWRLVAMPKEVVQYVVIHELCHLVYLNHSSLFWQLVAKFCPNYSQYRLWLKQNGHEVLNATF